MGSKSINFEVRKCGKLGKSKRAEMSARRKFHQLIRVDYVELSNRATKSPRHEAVQSKIYKNPIEFAG